MSFVAVAIIQPRNAVVGGIIVCLVYLCYFFVFEALWSRTPGKLMTGLRVRGTDGGKCSIAAAGIRTVARVIEAAPLLFGGIPAGIVILATKRKQRLGYILAGTVVVSKDVDQAARP